MYRYNEVAQVLQRSQGQEDGDGEAPGRKSPLELWLLQDTCMTQLLEPHFAADAVHFMVLEVSRQL